MTTDSAPLQPLPRLDTGIPGLGNVTSGGLPAGEVTLLGGVTGSGKTVFGMQYLVEGIRQFDQAGVFVSFAERPEKLRGFVGGFGWDIAAWERAARWEFVDATADVAAQTVVGDGFDFAVLINRITAAVLRVSARRVVLDSLTDLFARFGDRVTLRDAVRQLFAELERMEVTAVAILARRDDYGDISPFGVEEFVADNIILLRNPLEGEKRRRTIEVLKFRGASHRRGEFPFAITAEDGLVVIPLSVNLRQTSRDERTSSGDPVVDEMLRGGLFRDSITLVSGATGIGKTALALSFALKGIVAGEAAIYVGYEESSDQLARGIRAWGFDIDDLQAQGKLHFVNDYPEVATLEEHVVRIKAAIDRTGASRLALDSLTSLRRAGSARSFQEFTTGLTAYLKERHVTALLTTTQANLWGASSVTDEHVSTLSDVVVLLRYIEIHDEIRRGIAVLKQRGSGHDKSVREFTIDADGIHIGDPLPSPTGILGGRRAAEGG